MTDIILQIPAQPATNNIPRQMTLVEIDIQHKVVAEARDFQIPSRIRFGKGDKFPWDQFLQRLSVLWFLSRNESIPRGFRLLKPLPTELSELIPKLSSKESLDVLRRLDTAGYIRAFH